MLPADAAGGAGRSPSPEKVRVLGIELHVRTGPEAGAGPEQPMAHVLLGGGPEAGGGPLRAEVSGKQELFDSVVRESFTTVFRGISLKSCTAESADGSVEGSGEGDGEDSFQVCNLDTGEVRPLDIDRGLLCESFVGDCAKPALLKGAGAPWRGWWREKQQQDELLWSAAASGSPEAIREALATSADGRAPAQVNSRALHGRTALHIAASQGCPRSVEALLQAGATVGSQTDAGLTALHVAAQRGHLEVAKLLLDAGADACEEAADGSLAIHLAAADGRAAVVGLLLDRGDSQQLRARNRFGQRPAEVAMDIETAVLLRWRNSGSAVQSSSASSDGGSESTGASSSEDRYAGRTPFCDGTVLLHNARADVVRRLLRLTQQPPSEAFSRGALDPSSGSCTPPRTPPRSRTLVGLPRACPGSWSAEGNRVRSGSFARIRAGSPEVKRVGPSSFALVKMLGKGAFGEVYQVAHKRTQQHYAMKILRKSKVMSGNMLKYAVTERNVLSYLRHPYIVSLHYAFQTSHHLVLVLQFCSRGNLQTLIEAEQRLQEPLARLYAAEVLLALAHLHERQVIFRDMKPENVVIDEDGHAMLTDFGLSKEGVEGLHGAQSFCGSLAFIAPEVLMRKGHGHTVDLYGLGVLLFTMLTGLPPYFHPDRDMLLNNIRSGQLRVPLYVSRVAATMVQALVERDPARRLGATRTIDALTHPFFFGLDWDALLRREVPSPLQPARELPNALPGKEGTSPSVVTGGEVAGGPKGGAWRRLRGGIGVGIGAARPVKSPCLADADAGAGGGGGAAAGGVAGWEFASAPPQPRQQV